MDKATQETMFSSKTGEHRTPQWLFDHFNAMYDFTLDAAASDENALCNKYYTKETNGLAQPWANERVWLNPPYGRKVSHWVLKAKTESMFHNALVVMLLAARTDTQWFHHLVMGYAEYVMFIKGRLTFEGASAPAPFPSIVVIYQPLLSLPTQFSSLKIIGTRT